MRCSSAFSILPAQHDRGQVPFRLVTMDLTRPKSAMQYSVKEKKATTTCHIWLRNGSLGHFWRRRRPWTVRGCSNGGNATHCREKGALEEEERECPHSLYRLGYRWKGLPRKGVRGFSRLTLLALATWRVHPHLSQPIVADAEQKSVVNALRSYIDSDRSQSRLGERPSWYDVAGDVEGIMRAHDDGKYVPSPCTTALDVNLPGSSQMSKLKDRSNIHSQFFFAFAVSRCINRNGLSARKCLLAYLLGFYSSLKDYG